MAAGGDVVAPGELAEASVEVDNGDDGVLGGDIAAALNSSPGGRGGSLDTCCQRLDSWRRAWVLKESVMLFKLTLPLVSYSGFGLTAQDVLHHRHTEIGSGTSAIKDLFHFRILL
jgi:hypothetical protein